MKQVTVSSVVAIPKNLVSLDDIRKAFSFTYKKYADPEVYEVCAYTVVKDYYRVPRQAGLRFVEDRGFVIKDKMASGARITYPKKIAHTGDYAYQEPIVRQLVDALKENNDVLFDAHTGSGKTQMALSVAQRLGTTLVVVVDQENIKIQWIERIEKTLGVPASEIGIIQGSKCKFEGCKIAVCMIQSLTRKDYPEELADYFGMVVFDEVHITGAETFSTALSFFSARYRLGVSATMKRTDALQKLIHMNLGDTIVKLHKQHDTSFVYYIESKNPYSWYGNISPKDGRILSEIAEDTERNEKIVEAACWLHEQGRDTLIISDRIEQLEWLAAMLYYSGVPDEDIGICTGFTNPYRFQKDPTPKRVPLDLEDGAEYTPVMFGTQEKRTPVRVRKHVQSTAKLLLATYHVFAKAVDEPRLSAGIDASPRSRSTQVHGRILRYVEGKPTPIWVTVRDINSYKLEHKFASRVREYMQSNAEIYLWRRAGIKQKDGAMLAREALDNSEELSQYRIDSHRGRYLVSDQLAPKGKGRGRAG